MDFNKTVDTLSNIENSELLHYGIEGIPFPSVSELRQIVEVCRATLFPGFSGKPVINVTSLKYYEGVNVEQIYEMLVRQIVAGLALMNNNSANDTDTHNLWKKARSQAHAFIESLPDLRDMLETDVKAHFRNDPAAHNLGEVILCYPGMRAITNYRIAHRLVELDVPLIPRMITELAHSETGIDIHPAARIGHSFAIDHGTGVVIGATSIIGHNVTLYQGVTLGAKNFPQEEDGSLVKGIDRHPILGDNVVVYANATILGRITIGSNTTIGGNLWVTHDVPADTKLFYRQQQ